MIVSASYKTDIPAFYSAWLRARLAAGRCRMVNPWGGQVHEIDLRPGAVAAMVLWTRNIAPLAADLPRIRRRFYPFAVHYTVTGYPRALESSVPAPGHAIGQIRRLAAAFGPRAVVWRYDPVLFTGLTPPGWHRDNFARLAAALAGATDEVVVSFAQIYRKTHRNLEAAARRHGFAWEDPDDDAKRALLADLAAIAAERGMRLTICAQPALHPPGAAAARCIDTVRLSEIAGRPIAARPSRNRPGCACAEARDIGGYDSCAHGCVYCYAVGSHPKAHTALRAHDPAADSLR